MPDSTDDSHDTPEEWRRRLEALRALFVRIKARHHLGETNLNEMLEEEKEEEKKVEKAVIETVATSGATRDPEQPEAAERSAEPAPDDPKGG